MDLVIIVMSMVAGSIISPFVLSKIQNRQRKIEREEDFRRQNKVADLLEEVNNTTTYKLDSIHILVNSNMTAAMQSELDAITRELAMMKEVIALNRAAGREPSIEAVEALQLTEIKIDELAAQLDDRARQGRITDLKSDIDDKADK